MNAPFVSTPISWKKKHFGNAFAPNEIACCGCKNVNPSATETYIFRKSAVNTMATDASAPCVARTWAAMVLTIQDKLVLSFHEEDFQPPVPSRCWEKCRKCEYIFYVSSNIFNTVTVNSVTRSFTMASVFCSLFFKPRRICQVQWQCVFLIKMGTGRHDFLTVKIGKQMQETNGTVLNISLYHP